MVRGGSASTSKFWRDPHLGGLDILQADFVDHRFAPHSHDALVVVVTDAGGTRFTSRGISVSAGTRELLVFNPGEVHAGGTVKGGRWCYRALYLDEDVIANVARSVGLPDLPYFGDNAINDGDLVASFANFHGNLQRGQDPMADREGLIASFGMLFERYGGAAVPLPPSPQDRELVDRVVAVMHRRFAEPLTLEALGQPDGLTSFQLINIFKRVLGSSPYAYLTQIRLGVAIRLIKSGLPLPEAALDAGFYDQSALNHHFKRTYGTTPLQYVRAQAACRTFNKGQ
jgi:AraC-like DNA-binding protein